MLAHAPPYQVFICDVSMASIAEEVGPEYVSTIKLKFQFKIEISTFNAFSPIIIIDPPFDLLGRLSPEVSDGVSWSLCLSRVYRDLCVVVRLLVFHFYRHQQ